jgi:hypothetical protein
MLMGTNLLCRKWIPVRIFYRIRGVRETAALTAPFFKIGLWTTGA